MADKRILFPSDRAEQEIRQRLPTRPRLAEANSSQLAASDSNAYEPSKTQSSPWWSLKDITSPEWQLLLVSTAFKVLLFPA